MITTRQNLSVCHLWAWWTSIVPDVFGLRAFDSREPISRMLLGQLPNELCVMIPDAAASPVDFHDIMLSDLRATPVWRARRIMPSDVTSLRRRWPKILFATMHKRQADMENLRRSCLVSHNGKSLYDRSYLT